MEEKPIAENSPEETDNHSEEDTIEDGVPFFPHHALKEVIAVYVVIGLVLSLAIIFPFNLHDKADPLSTPEHIKPEWYFLWVYQALKYFPKDMVIASGKTVCVTLIFGVVSFLHIVWPIIDNSPERHPARRKWGMTFVGISLILGFMLMLLGVLSGRTLEVGDKRYTFDQHGIPHHVTTTEHTDLAPKISLPGGLSEGAEQ